MNDYNDLATEFWLVAPKHALAALLAIPAGISMLYVMGTLFIFMPQISMYVFMHYLGYGFLGVIVGGSLLNVLFIAPISAVGFLDGEFQNFDEIIWKYLVVEIVLLAVIVYGGCFSHDSLFLGSSAFKIINN